MSATSDTSASVENAAARALINRVVTTVGPVTERVIAGEYKLLPAAAVSLDEVCVAVFMATGTMVREIVIVRQAELETVPRPAYGRTLDRGIELLFGYRLVLALGSKRWGQHRKHFGYEQVISLEVHLARSAYHLPWENLRAALFHYWGLALSRQDHLLDRLTPLVGLLPRAIPLGELAKRPGVWEVMVA